MRQAVSPGTYDHPDGSPREDPSGHGDDAPSTTERVQSLRRDIFAPRLLLGAGSPATSRALTRRQFDTLVGQIDGVLGRDAEVDVQMAYRQLVVRESLSLGRVAGSTPNILGKLVMSRLLSPPAASVLEIGTLFGVFAGALFQELSRSGDLPTLTLLDPLEGAQLQNGSELGPDRTGTPVTEPILRRNLAISSVPDHRVRIIKGYSTDPAIRTQAEDRTYDLVIVDGDHGVDGVRADLDWLSSFAGRDTIIVLDDYGDRRWPGVAAATDAFLAADRRFELFGMVATSAYLRVAAQG